MATAATAASTRALSASERRGVVVAVTEVEGLGEMLCRVAEAEGLVDALGDADTLGEPDREGVLEGVAVVLSEAPMVCVLVVVGVGVPVPVCDGVGGGDGEGGVL